VLTLAIRDKRNEEELLLLLLLLLLSPPTNTAAAGGGGGGRSPPTAPCGGLVSANKIVRQRRPTNIVYLNMTYKTTKIHANKISGHLSYYLCQ
jgi:hypothetical protein